MGIYFGALCDPIKKQIGFDSEVIKHCQKDADAVTRLLIRGLMTESSGRVARNRIAKHIEVEFNKKIGA